jgi:hypothetical protein
MTRDEAESHIENLYGLSPSGSLDADECLSELLEKMGTSALTDDAVIRLAEIQMDRNDATYT